MASLVFRILEKDKEIRQARTGYVLIASLFLGWSAIKLFSLFLLLANNALSLINVIDIVITVCVIGVTALAIKRVSSLSKLREKLISNPLLYLNSPVSSPPVLTTLIPFVLK